ncbi:hypothetical protein X275_03235 [Marinitoga sp. 1197]|uniref:hypothetical protein n=1 Tax=Marinitoga sp. 1197 TaxID=1428449 RepID=UPI00064146DE|nr:hypothetical protein [Marinitoga sp. 1197]KLO23357.1 hypothetical protein X275_03235 [Marinitoga sp. 1197]
MKNIFLIISFFSGVCGIFLFIFNYFHYGYAAVSIYTIILLFINYHEYKSSFSLKNLLLKTTLFFIIFPFYPLILLFQKRNLSPLYKEIDFSKYNIVNSKSIGFSSVDLAPFNIILKYGDPEQRKYVVRLVYNSIKNDKIDFVEGINLIRSAIKEDSHPDVILYASDALTNLENFLIKKISFYMKNLKTLKDYIDYGKYAYFYANSGFLAGEHKQEVLWQSSILLRTAIEIFPDSPKLIVITLKILESLNEFDTLEILLNEKINTIKAQEIYEYAIIYYIKRMKQKTVQKLVSDFIDLGFSAKHKSIKFLLGD